MMGGFQSQHSKRHGLGTASPLRPAPSITSAILYWPGSNTSSADSKGGNLGKVIEFAHI